MSDDNKKVPNSQHVLATVTKKASPTTPPLTKKSRQNPNATNDTPAKAETKDSKEPSKDAKKANDKPVTDKKAQDGKKSSGSKKVLIIGGIVMVVFAIIIGAVVVFQSNAKAKKIAAEKARLEQVRLEEEARQQEEARRQEYFANNPPQSWHDDLNALRENPEFATTHWLLRTDLTNMRIIKDIVEKVIKNDPRILQGQGIYVNDGRGVLPLNDTRFTSKVSEVERKVMSMTSDVIIEYYPTLDDPSRTVVGLRRSNGDFFKNVSEADHWLIGMEEAVNAEWTSQKMLIDADPTIINAKDGIIELQPSTPEVNPTEVDLERTRANLRSAQNRIRELEGQLTNLDRALADEVETTERERRLRLEEGKKIQDVLQKLENSPNAQSAIKAYDLQQEVKDAGIKIISVVGDLVYYQTKDGQIHTKRFGEVVNLGKNSGILSHLDSSSGAVVILPTK